MNEPIPLFIKPRYRIFFNDYCWPEYEYILKAIDETGHLISNELWYGFLDNKIDEV